MNKANTVGDGTTFKPINYILLTISEIAVSFLGEWLKTHVPECQCGQPGISPSEVLSMCSIYPMVPSDLGSCRFPDFRNRNLTTSGGNKYIQLNLSVIDEFQIDPSPRTSALNRGSLCQVTNRCEVDNRTTRALIIQRMRQHWEPRYQIRKCADRR